jgi:hypothetical protein
MVGFLLLLIQQIASAKQVEFLLHNTIIENQLVMFISKTRIPLQQNQNLLQQMQVTFSVA